MSEALRPTEADSVRPETPAHDWEASFARLQAADRDATLGGADLEALALAAFFVGRPDVEDDARERAFAATLAAGDDIRAAFLAVDIARHALFAGQVSIASGWVRRAERLLERRVPAAPSDAGSVAGTEPADDAAAATYAHGFLALIRSELAARAGRLDEALAEAERAISIGQAADDADLRAWSLAHLGELRIAAGATPDGIALLEEASTAAVSGELSPFTSGVTACRMIAACRDLSDYRRASEWIEATDRYCRRRSLTGFPGVCRIHRAEVAAINGAWDEAETDLRQATAELEQHRALVPVADGYYVLGDIRRLRGDVPGAEQALREAHARGRTPQPALALIRLAEGRARAALAAIEGALDEAGSDVWARARLLPARAEIQLANGDAAGARMSVEELAATTAGYPSPALEAGRRAALGRVLLAEGDAPTAARELRAAIRGWQEVGSPYEVARSRALLAGALRRLGDDDDARLELTAARDELHRLGAAPEADAADRALRELEDVGRAPEQVRRAFMFTDIVGSTTLAEALGDAAWERLLRWHDQTLRREIAAGGGEIVNSTGDGFFAAFPSARRAIDGAVAIQRVLRDHQEAIGFAPPVRIGVHVALANRRGDDYSGIGVHVAARVGALAGAGEIVATLEALDEAGIAPASEVREVPVKGVSVPVRVAAVGWG